MKFGYYFLIILLFSSCNFFNEKNSSKTLSVIMQNNILGSVFKDTFPEGFQYEIIKKFCDSFDYQLNIISAENIENAVKQFEKDKADILAHAMPTTVFMKQKLDFSVPLYKTKLVLLQKKRGKKEKNLFADNIYDLEEQTVYLPEYLQYIRQLEYMIEDSGIQFNIVKSGQNIEKLAGQVAAGKIQYLAVNEFTARYLGNKNKELDFSVPLGLNQFMAWGINKKNKKINEQINLFLKNFVKTEKYRQIYIKYFS